MRLKDACLDAGQYGVNVSPEEYRSAGLRMLRTSDLTEGGLTPDEDGVFLDGPVPSPQILQENDLLLSRAGTVGRSYLVPASGAGGTFAGFLIRFRPRHGIDPRFLHYCLRSKATQDQISAEAVTSTIQNFNAERYANLPIPDVSGREQRRVADFLDDRVAGIDQIITARQVQQSLGAQEFRSAMERTVWSGSDRMPLKHLLRSVTSGPRGWGDLVREEGTPFVRIGNLRPLGIDLLRTNLVRVDMPTDAEAQRASLEDGDVLLSITAAFGEVAVWRSGEGTFSQHVARLRPSDRADSEWIAWTLQTPTVHDQYRLLAYGGTKIGMGLDHVRNLQVPRILAQERTIAAAAITTAWGHYSAGREAIQRSIQLLSEYKQSLITAAVTGEFDVTTAGSGIPG